METRVRFAPSPTGALHIGGIRTALFNYLFARKTGGKMLLRIEDTDQKRLVPGAEEYILESLAWLGIGIDEGQSVGGPHAPYRQSERQAVYRPYVEQLISQGKAYYAFDTAEELDAMRQRLTAANVDNPSYNALTRTQMRNSLTLPAAEVQQLLVAGTPYSVRVKMPLKEEIRFRDLIRDWVVVHANTLDDKVLLKSDGMPTYHLANIVDDHLMGITHVIRGEEWLPSAPLHVLLYRYLGWEPPQLAHLPLLLNPDGEGKLSKRKADKYGFPVFPLDWQGTDAETGQPVQIQGFREAGYLPDALVNFLALLGWNPGTEQEIFSMDELIEAFSLERIQKAGSRFDIEKAKWFNQHYLRAKPDADLAGPLAAALAASGVSCLPETAVKIVRLLKDRVTFPHEIHGQAMFLFHAPDTYEAAVAQSKWTPEADALLGAFADELDAVGDFNAESAKAALNAVLERAGVKIAKVMQALRLALTGTGHGPDLMQVMDILGRDETARRIAAARQRLGTGA